MTQFWEVGGPVLSWSRLVSSKQGVRGRSTPCEQMCAGHASRRCRSAQNHLSPHRPSCSLSCRNSICWLHMRNETGRCRSFSVRYLGRKVVFPTEGWTPLYYQQSDSINWRERFWENVYLRIRPKFIDNMGRAEAKGIAGTYTEVSLLVLAWKCLQKLKRPLWSKDGASMEGGLVCRGF